jgi:hypothetical protein
VAADEPPSAIAPRSARRWLEAHKLETNGGACQALRACGVRGAKGGNRRAQRRKAGGMSAACSRTQTAGAAAAVGALPAGDAARAQEQEQPSHHRSLAQGYGEAICVLIGEMS